MQVFRLFQNALQQPPVESAELVSPEESIVISASSDSPDSSPGSEAEASIVVNAEDNAAASRSNSVPLNGAQASNREMPAVANGKPAAPVPCLQLPEYPGGSSSYHSVGTIEEYKILLELGTRSTWPARFSESDYLIMARWLGMDKYQPARPQRACPPETENSPEKPNAQESSQLQPVTDTIPSVVVPATPKSPASPSVPPRPRGTYY